MNVYTYISNWNQKGRWERLSTLIYHVLDAIADFPTVQRCVFRIKLHRPRRLQFPHQDLVDVE